MTSMKLRLNIFLEEKFSFQINPIHLRNIIYIENPIYINMFHAHFK